MNGIMNLECQAAQETRLIMEKPSEWKKLQEMRLKALLRAMELQRAEDVKQIMDTKK